MSLKKTLSSLLLLFGNCLAIHSQNDSILMNKTLEEFVVTGNFEGKTRENAVALTNNITISKLASLGLQNVGDVLKYQANIRTQQDNILGTSMTLQGVSGENVKILIDGIPVVGRQNGNVDLSQLILSNVERIEVIEGPLSVQYGTNALAGTINIITKKKPSKKLELQSNAYYESTGHYNAGATIGWRGENQSAVVSGGRNFFDGWSEVENTRFLNWKPKIQCFANLNYNATLGKTKLGYMGNFFDEHILNRGLPIAPYNERAFDDQYNTTRFTNAVNISHSFDNQLNTNVVFSYNSYVRTKNTYYRDLVNLSETLTNNVGDQDTSRFSLFTSRATISKSSNKKFKYEVGYDINVENGTGLRIKENKQQIGDYAAFLTAEWQITEGVILKPGLRASYNSAYNAPLIPSFQALWKVTDKLTARASYARGFRSPSLKELYLYFVDINHNIRGNEALEAENSHNFNASLAYKKVLDKHIFKFETTGFYNDINNLITLAILRGQGNEYGYINVGQYKTYGGQFFGEAVLNNFTVAAGVAYNERKNIIDETTFKAGSWESRFNLTYKIPRIGLDFNLWYKFTGEQAGFVLNEDKTVVPTFMSSFHTADLGFSKKFLKNKVQFSAGIKNIFNVKNIQSQLVSGAHGANGGFSPVGTGRNFFTKIEIFL